MKGVDYIIFGDGFIGNYLGQSLSRDKNLRVLLIADKVVDDIIVPKYLDLYPYAIPINCIGKTGRPNIDWCQATPKNKKETHFSNYIVPTLISVACQEAKRYWINIGSGCIYDGYDKQWTEEDPPNYTGSYYSHTKKIADGLLRCDPHCLNIRIRMPISEQHHERSFIDKILNIARTGKLMSRINSVTYLPDLTRAIHILGDRAKDGKPETGVLNLVNPKPLSHRQMLNLYQKIVDPKFAFETHSVASVMKGLKAGRCNTVLSSEKAIGLGIPLHTTTEALKEVFNMWAKLD